MPELPEVETIARTLRQGSNGIPPLPGRTIQEVELNWPRHIAEPSPPAFKRGLRGQEILDVQRRGKYLVFPLENGTLLIHLRMTGDLSLFPAEEQRGPYDHTVFHLDGDWELRFSDARKFGQVRWVEDPQVVFSSLGPEPLTPQFTPEVLREQLKGRSRALKPLLLEQSFVAGLGNIYADEALHLAKLHPLTPADRLTEDNEVALWEGIRAALQAGIEHQGTSLDWVYPRGTHQNRLHVYGREGEPCHTCQTAIERIVVAQRGTHFCPRCQAERPSP